MKRFGLHSHKKLVISRVRVSVRTSRPFLLKNSLFIKNSFFPLRSQHQFCTSNENKKDVKPRRNPPLLKESFKISRFEDYPDDVNLLVFRFFCKNVLISIKLKGEEKRNHLMALKINTRKKIYILTKFPELDEKGQREKWEEIKDEEVLNNREKELEENGKSEIINFLIKNQNLSSLKEKLKSFLKDDAETKDKKDGKGTQDKKKEETDDPIEILLKFTEKFDKKIKNREELKKKMHKEMDEFIQAHETKRKTQKKNNANPFTAVVLNMIAAAIVVSILTKLAQTGTATENNVEVVGMNRVLNEYLPEGKVKKVVVHSKQNSEVILTNGKRLKVNLVGLDDFQTSLEKEQEKLGVKVIDYIPVEITGENQNVHLASQFMYRIASISLTVMMIAGLYKLSKRGPMGSNMMGGVKKKVKSEKVKTRLKDVAGLTNAKLEVTELAQFLKDSSQFTRLGARVPKGALLVGPPGTGKTLIARAIAGESECSFFSASGSEFLEMFVGMGASRVRKLFAEARKSAPSIVFIDEIDALGGKRSSSPADDERDRTLNQLLVEMDGFKKSENVVVLAGTNRVDMLDKALLRPGRFDRKITIDLPDILERKEIFKVHLKPIKLDSPPDEIAQRLASLTPGFSGADISNVCNEGAIVAARKKKATVSLQDFESAFDRVVGGMEKAKSVLTQNERTIVAHHEAGHAIAGWFLPHADPLLKVTIKPRVGGALGFAQLLPKELRIHTEADLRDLLCVALGGRVAEQLFFGHLSTGAADDLEKVTRLAYTAIKVFGMSDRVGHLSFPERDELQQRMYSDETADLMDGEASEWVKKAYETVYSLLSGKKKLIAKLAEELLERETLTHDDLVLILGERPFKTFQYKKYLENTLVGNEKKSKA